MYHLRFFLEQVVNAVEEIQQIVVVEVVVVVEETKNSFGFRLSTIFSIFECRLLGGVRVLSDHNTSYYWEIQFHKGVYQFL